MNNLIYQLEQMLNDKKATLCEIKHDIEVLEQTIKELEGK